MRILYVSQYFPPEPGAPAARVSELAVRWVETGHEVTVLTGFPQHPAGVVPPQYRGRVFAQESHRGVDVVRSYVYASPNAGVARRSISFASYAASSVLLGPASALVRRADVVLATSPQFLCALSGWALSRMLRKPYVLEVRDLWPQSIVDLGVLGERHPIIVGLRGLERFVYGQADRLVGVTDAFAEVWRGRGVDPGKIRVVKNGVDLERFAPMPREEARRDLGWGDAFVVAYIGTHGLAHALDRLLDVAARFEHDPGVRFVFAGDGARRIELHAEARRRGLGRVEFLGPQPRDRVPQLLAACDLVAVTLRDIPLFAQVIPSKIFEVMGCARPIMLGVRGESADIVRSAGAGFVVPPEDVDAMHDAIVRARRDPAALAAMGAAGRDHVERHFDRNVLADRYADYLAEVV